MQKLPDVILFKKYAFHKSCMHPISKELSKLEIDHLVESKRHKIYDMSDENNKFKVFVIGDEWADLFRKNAEILCTTGHSMANKNTTLDKKNSAMDYIYVPSQYYKTEFIKRGIFPRKNFVVTGYPPATKIFKFVNQKIKKVGPKNVLFAPTYNRDLSIMDALIKAEREHSIFEKMFMFDIVFKLHPVLPKKYPEHHQFVLDLAAKYHFINYHVDSHDDIAINIINADIMIGDCSGALLLGASGDIPIIAYNNSNRERSEYYDPTGPEWVFRDKYAKIIGDDEMSFLPNIIFGSIQEDFLKRNRREVVNLLFDHQLDAEVQVAQHIQGLVG